MAMNNFPNTNKSKRIIDDNKCKFIGLKWQKKKKTLMNQNDNWSNLKGVICIFVFFYFFWKIFIVFLIKILFFNG